MFSKSSYSLYVKANISKRVLGAKKKLCNRILADTDEFVPYKSGKLASDVDYLEDYNGIRYSASYAPFVLDMPDSNNFTKETHANAAGDWTGKSLRKNSKDWYEMFKKEIE